MKLSKGFIFSFLGSLSWAIGIIITKIILLSNENAFNLAFWSTILATPYWLWVFIKNKPKNKSLNKKDLLILVSMSLISTVGVSIIEAFALKYSSTLNYSFLIRTIILFTIILAYFFLNEKLTLKKLILATLILIGSYLLITNGQKISLSKGDIFTLIEALLIAFGNNILGKLATKRLGCNLSSSASFLLGILPLTVITITNNAISIPKSPLLIILLAIVFLLTMKFRFQAYQHATASFITMIYSFTPVLVSLIAIPVLKETLTLTQIIGGILIILSGVLVEKLKI